jgi:hypothetical protein
MPPRKHKPYNAAKAAARAAAQQDDEELDAILEAAIRLNEAVPSSLAAQRVRQEYRDARTRAEQASRTSCASCLSLSKANTIFCDGCDVVGYCSAECQTAHAPVHVLRCRALRAVEIEAAVAARAADKAAREMEPGTPDAGNCWTCGAANPSCVCTACKVAKYCDRMCQGWNWMSSELSERISVAYQAVTTNGGDTGKLLDPLLSYFLPTSA